MTDSLVLTGLLRYLPIYELDALSLAIAVALEEDGIVRDEPGHLHDIVERIGIDVDGEIAGRGLPARAAR